MQQNNQAVEVKTATSSLMNKRSMKRGFATNQIGALNAVETAMVLVVGVLAIGAAVAWGPKLFNGNTDGIEIQNVAHLLTATSSLRTQSGYGSSGTNLNAALIAADEVPSTMTISGTNITNAFGGAVTVSSTGTGFTISYAGVPKSNCIALATKVASSVNYTTKIGSGTAITGEVTNANAVAGCTGTANTITWTSSN